MSQPKVLIIVPALNEGRVIRRLVGEIRQRYPEYSIVVVNDGSVDDTAAEAEAEGVRVINLPHNLGIGGAVQTGYKLAWRHGYDAAVQIDGDAQHDPSYLADVLSPVLNDQLDLCIGSRFLVETSGFKSTPARRLGILFFAGLLGWLTGIHITDPTSGFRACNRKLIRAFAQYYPVDFPEPETIQSARRMKARIGEVPVRMRKRLGGISSIRYLRTLYYMIKVTFAILIDTLKGEPKT